MSINCIKTCVDFTAWRASNEIGDSQADSNFADDLGAIMHLATGATPAAQTQSNGARQEQAYLRRQYVNSLLEGSQQRGLDGIGVLSAIVYVATEPENCGQCPFGTTLDRVSE